MNQGEKDSIKDSIRQMMATPSGQIYIRELTKFKTAACDGLHLREGEKLAKEAGAIYGMNIALNLEKYI